MVARVTRRLYAALVLLPLMAGVGLAAGVTAQYYVCSGDAVARLECCCPGGMLGMESPAGSSSMTAPCCCAVVRVAPPAAPVATSAEGTVPPSKAALVVVNPIEPPASRVSTAAAMAAWVQHPPGEPVPILLRKQSFLV
jgi:hypothetical protein